MSKKFANVAREIEQTHQLLDDWIAGKAEEQAFFQRFESAFHENFTFVNSNGKEINRSRFLEHLRQLEGQNATTRIWAENIRTICSSESFIVVGFDEYEDDKQVVRSRVSTVVFQVHDSQPNGLCWVRLHETRKTTEDDVV